ncbi:MAG: permease [Hyphomicrobiaceae bacterium]
MSQIIEDQQTAAPRRPMWAFVLLGLVGAYVWLPGQVSETLGFVVKSMITVAPLVVPGILISAWVTASGAGGRIAQVFEGKLVYTILMASLVGAITPVCGVTVLPLMAGLLASGVPFAPVMAFWLSSPVTDPAMFSATAATLGWGFAVAKSVAAFGLGLLGGFTVAGLSSRAWTRAPLRQNRLLTNLIGETCCSSLPFKAAVWSSPERRAQFRRELWAMTRLVAICLAPAFAAEHVMSALLQPEALATYVGTEAWWAIPLAVFVGSPAYLDGYAALPLTRGLIDHGMSLGAAMAFLVSGSVVSIWGAMAIFPVLKINPFLAYLVLAVVGSLCAGWLYALVA